MAGPGLPTNIAATYAGSATDPSGPAHDAAHDKLHAFANKYDVDAVPGDGQVPTFVAATGLYTPKNPGSGSADFTATPYVVSAASGGTGAYPVRPATTRPVLFRGTVAPSTDGSTSGTGGMVLGLDQWFYWSSANAGSGGAGSSSGGAASVQRYEISAASLTGWPSSGTEAQKLAAINANTTTVRTALINNPGKHVVLDPQQPWPMQVDINEFSDTSFPAGQSYMLSGPAMLCRGTKASSGDTATTRIVAKPVLSITRAAGSNVFTPTNLRNNVQLGPSAPSYGSVFTSVSSGFDVASGAAQFKAGQVWHLCSNDGYAWSSRAGYTNVWQAAMFPIAGLMIVVTGESYTALSAAATQTPAISSLERRTIVGATSGAVALVQGDISGTNQIVVNSVSKDFTSGETLKDQATNATVGTFGGCTVLMSGCLNTTYATTPQLRLLTRSTVDISGLRVSVEADQDDYVPLYNRTDAVFLTGCTDVNLDGAKIGGGYLAGIVLRSCWNSSGRVDVRGLANHALEVADSTQGLSPSGMPIEGAYGYCVRMLGATQNFGISINAEYGRHCETTNGVGGSWNLDSRTGSTSGSVNLCTNFWNHGPGARKGWFSGKGAHMYGTAWDTHEGAEDIVWLNPVAIDPMSAARSTTSADGATFRGFNLTLINPYFSGVRVGLNDQAIALGAGGLVWTNRVIGGYMQAQYYPYAQTEDADYDSESRFVLDGVTLRGDPTIASSVMAQAGMLLKRGNIRTKNVRIEAINDRMVRHGSYVGSGSTSVGRVIHEDITFDWTDSTASRAFSFEATYASVDINGAHAYVNPTAGTQRPLQWFVNQAGDTVVRYKGLMASPLSSTLTQPSTTPSITAGSPTFTNLDPTGGTSTPTHSTTAAPTITPVADGGANGTGGTVAFESGYTSTDLAGVIRVTPAGTVVGSATTIATITFGTAFASKPIVTLSPSEGNSTTDRNPYVVNVSTTGFEIRFKSALGSGTAYLLAYNAAGV